MSDVAIRVEGLGKRYRIGASQAPYRTLRETLVDAAQAPFRRLAAVARGEASRSNEVAIWALKDVSFEVKQGEVLGVIGRNGAGKSTLLKILSRITKPTQGRVDLVGRVGSLLEVGTGFHPELTGRENIYLNGAILGMRRAEIDRKFDEIVAFAEVEKFLDTPVKHYSSGMYVRLAFAVAAHMETELLLVDEVLAVGDIEFQRKCLSKMGNVASEGRTVLFVSHNMGAVANLCTRGLLLDLGRTTVDGSVQQVVDSYLKATGNAGGEVSLEGPRKPSVLKFLAVRVLDDQGAPSEIVGLSRGCKVQIVYEIASPVSRAQIAFELWNEQSVCVLSSSDLDEDSEGIGRERPRGRYAASCYIDPSFLRPGRYWIDLGASIPGWQMLDEVRNAIAFQVRDTGSPASKLGQGRRGVISPVISWSTVLVEGEKA
jgi:lipopolysaccharide transport system ATP-binding protein